MSHNFPPLPISLHRKAVEETCSLCGVHSWRYKDGSRWVEREECTGTHLAKRENEMKKIKQTILHDPPSQNGNCFQAVISTVTGIPIEDILPVQELFSRDDWNISLFCWLKERGWLWRGAPEYQFWFNLGR